VAEPFIEEIIRYLASTRDCWWTARRIAAVLPHTGAGIEETLELCWRQGRLRRKRGIRGEYEYQARFAEPA
jgi:hypothetical protein